MNSMTDTKDESAKAGSSVAGGGGSGPSGESQVNLDDFIPKSQYAELEQKMGSMGQELGDLRKFYQELTPLLDKLDENPEIVEALREGKLDGQLAKAILEGKITVAEAKEVSKANDEIKKDMGDAAYKQVDPDALAQQILEKVSASLAGVKDELKKEISDVRSVNEFEQSVAKFISTTPDYSEYADLITAHLEEHPEHEDIEMVYHLVKGRELTKASAEARAKADVEASKNAVPPATGSSRGAPAEKPGVEQYVQLGRSANTFG